MAVPPAGSSAEPGSICLFSTLYAALVFRRVACSQPILSDFSLLVETAGGASPESPLSESFVASDQVLNSPNLIWRDLRERGKTVWRPIEKSAQHRLVDGARCWSVQSGEIIQVLQLPRSTHGRLHAQDRC